MLEKLIAIHPSEGKSSFSTVFAVIDTLFTAALNSTGIEVTNSSSSCMTGQRLLALLRTRRD